MHSPQTHNLQAKLEGPKGEVRNFKEAAKAQVHNSKGDKTWK
jgi:hypothetical protein